MLNIKLKTCCDKCKFAAIKTDVRPPYLARVMDGKPDGEIIPYCVTVTCDHIHVCKDYAEVSE